MSITLTQDKVEGLFYHMCAKFDATIVQSKDFLQFVPQTDEIEMFIKMLDVAGIDIADFLDRYAFTFGRFIVVPYNPGDFNKWFSLDGQAINLCHELIHRLQWRDDGACFAIYYTTSRSKRAHYEAEAMHADWMLYYLFTGRLPSFNKISKMSGIPYLVREGDVQTTKQHLKIFGDGVLRGTVKNEVVDEAVRYLLED